MAVAKVGGSRTSNRLLVAPKAHVAAGGRFLQLRHPRSNNEVVYMIAPPPQAGDGPCTLLEVNKYRSPRASMFVDQEVHQDGSVYMLTPVDPLFNLIAVFKDNEVAKTGHFVPLEDVVDFRFGQGNWQLGDTIDKSQLENICEVQAVGNENYYRLSDAKIMTWLEQKVRQTAQFLATQNTVSMAAGASSSSFVKATSNGPGASNGNAMEKQTLSYALQLVSEYVPSKRGAQLKQRIAALTPASAPAVGRTAKADGGQKLQTENSAKRKSNGDAGPLDDYTVYNKPVAKRPKMPANAKLRKKVEGQTLLSFGKASNKKK